MTMGTVEKWLAALVLYFICIGLCYPTFALNITEVTARGEVGETALVICNVTPETANITWYYKQDLLGLDERKQRNDSEHDLIDKDNDGNINKTKISTIVIMNATAEDAGNYTCVATLGDEEKNWSAALNMSFPVKLNYSSESPMHANATSHQTIEMKCIFEVYKLDKVVWHKTNSGVIDGEESHGITKNYTRIAPRLVESIHLLNDTGTENNGTYICSVTDLDTQRTASGYIDLYVHAKPLIAITEVIAINTTQLFINWTVQPFNAPIKKYEVMYAAPGTGFVHSGHINTENTSYVLGGLKKSTNYTVRVRVETDYGITQSEYPSNVTTLDKEPVFVPIISINGFSATSVTIGFTAPPEEIDGLIHYYWVEAESKNGTVLIAYHHRDNNNLPYMFGNLQPHNTYVFRAKACSYYSKICGEWSMEMEAATLDGTPGKASNVSAHCGVSYLNLTWGPPEKPNAEIKGYAMELTGVANYTDRNGIQKEDIWGPFSKFMANHSTSVRVDELQPNTLYTVTLSAVTRTRRRGEESTTRCKTRPAPPDTPPRPRWRKVLINGTFLFKTYLPRISERNGPICCYRVYLVRLPPNKDFKHLPSSPKDIEVIDYEASHTTFGAYIADILTSNNYPKDGELVIGDRHTVFQKHDSWLNREECSQRCRLKRPGLTTTTSTTTTQMPTNADLFDDAYTDSDIDVTTLPTHSLVRRSADRYFNSDDFGKDPMMAGDSSRVDHSEVKVEDGALDPNSFYTLFVELIPGQEGEDPMYSEYVNELMPAAGPSPPALPSTSVEVALQATCGVAALILVVMVAYCVVQARRGHKLPPHAHELSSLPNVFRRIACKGKRQQIVSNFPRDLPPIAKEDLADAYLERSANSDYKFQEEFEWLQMLPECYTDRTTHASEARENQPKNRYPDIKAYDQTRVKLSQIDGVIGSDYINANYVMGYKEAKQFICAQGPTDATVNDFWRMIWEQGLELIVMLTNLEEYSKVKCSKYWPDDRASRTFGSVTVQHHQEKRYSDYIVRELRITKQPPNSEGQPIVENGIAKRNGDCKEGSESSAPTSPREQKEGEVRLVRQYHFLMWKDFAAPDHAHSILKFIKRVNCAWSGVIGRPAVVHCSAGVGRTGTLVALDCLLDQLRATNHAAVFNTVAELRRQRNFLVQSLKQYIFVYRALVEYAHYGDTEIPASRLRSSIDRLRNTPEGADKCLMEHQFEKILNNPIPEPLKSCAAGAGEELRSRNRAADCLPYDRNRVILAPIPGRDYSTYINASFIEAYDNTEGFIITQDPLPTTIMDFWRMVSEHNVTTIVMLSELGEGKCPRYWEDGTAQYEHMSVHYEESESCPYYTRRQFRLTNTKSGAVSSVRQLQYQGWPTAPGHVPEVTRGLAELADAALPAPLPAPPPAQPTMLVHCQLGVERSALFVALCTLIGQLRGERRIDVCSLTRTIRSQRARTIDTFLQYEFLHRAILNYAELHNLLEDS